MEGPEVAAEEEHQRLVGLAAAEPLGGARGGELQRELHGLVHAQRAVAKVAPLGADRGVPDPAGRGHRCLRLAQHAVAAHAQLDALEEADLQEVRRERQALRVRAALRWRPISSSATPSCVVSAGVANVGRLGLTWIGGSSAASDAARKREGPAVNIQRRRRS